jgi:hypothetical protein
MPAINFLLSFVEMDRGDGNFLSDILFNKEDGTVAGLDDMNFGFTQDTQPIGMKTIQIFSDPIRDRIHLKRFRYAHIRVRIFSI